MGFFGKRGEGLTIRQIVILVCGIIGFGIIFFFIVGFDFNNMSQDEICRLSILTRATAPTEAQGIVPINCATEKICFSTFGGGKCEDNFAGEKAVQIIRLPDRWLSGNDRENARKMMESTIVESFYDCWSITGKGKLDLFGNYMKSRGLSKEQPVCILCSRVAIDKSVNQKSQGLVESIDVYAYMERTKVPRQTMTYLQALTDKQVNSYSSVKGANFIKSLDESKVDNSITLNVPPDNNEIAIVFSQVKAPKLIDAWANLGKDAMYLGATAFVMPYIGKYIRRLVLTKAGLTVVGIAALSGAAYSWWNVYQGQQLAAGYCGPFTTNDESSDENDKKGCSLVQTVPYKAANINALCPQLEGRP